MSVLSLTPAQVELQMIDGNITRRPVSHYLDMLVDGQSLVGIARGQGNLVTDLNRAWLHAVPAAIEALLGRRAAPDLDPGRVPLLVCSFDGDLGCGAITAALVLTDATVTWRDFRWENGYTEPDDAEGMPPLLTFDREQYEQELGSALERVSQLPHDEAEHQGRGFLWPWQWGWQLPPRA